METLPRITIITPSYNQCHFIEQTIDSVLSQNYPDLEYIVIDGGSTDNTLEILKKYDGKLLWISERDRGQSHAINKGLRMATGEIIAFLNSDDLYAPGALLKVGKFFAAHPEARWFTGRCRTIDPKGNEIRKAITLYKNVWLRIKSYRALLVLNYISQPATFWSRKVIDMVGEFDESLRYAMDYDYSLRVGRSFKLWVLDDYLASFRVHPSSKAGSSANAQFDSEFKIAKRYTTSPLLVGLHAAHNALTVNIYRILMSSNQLVTQLKVSGTE
jgi:glycosyltransferase involved in cell wall biosynthesis